MLPVDDTHNAAYYDYRADERGGVLPPTQPADPWAQLQAPAAPVAPSYAGVSMPKLTDPMVAAAGGGSVYSWVLDTFKQYGMGDVGTAALGAIQSARSPEEAMVSIRGTDAYKTRFAGNIARAKNGYGMLSEGNYLQLESSYRQTMRAAGLPVGFYDSPNDLSGFIAGDVSPSELGQRAKTAMDLVNNRDPQELKTFKDYYGIDKGHLAAYYLDPHAALPILQKQADTAAVGAEAARAGMHAQEGFAAHLNDAGINPGQARQAFADTQEQSGTLAKLASIDGQKIAVNDIVDSKLGLNQATDAKLTQQKRNEAARFNGRSGGTAALAAGGAGSF